jgi:hypothetical protein
MTNRRASQLNLAAREADARMSAVIDHGQTPWSDDGLTRFGTGLGSMEILGDIVGPISDISDWAASRDSDENK